MADGKDDFLKQAYGLQDLEDAMAFYQRWADDYDQQMEGNLQYVAPRQTAEHLARFVDDRSVAVLDIGCGTGLTSHYLAEQGFETFDGLDFNEAMLERAGTRGIYRALIRADLTRPLEIDDESYGAAISSGTFTLGHVGPEPIPEIFRVLRSGAYFACTVHRDIWRAQGFEAAFAALETAG
ncbi:MAG: class I SAM-dependent DNA methyltransferase, partial [Hyphomicrobiales bacterium]